MLLHTVFEIGMERERVFRRGDRAIVMNHARRTREIENDEAFATTVE